MLSSLPPELLRDIIEATVPHAFHSKTYDTRQQTLCSLSLVSKLFRSIAQPLLLEIVSVKSVRQLEILPPDIDEGGGGANSNQRTKSAVIKLLDNIDFLPGNFGAGFRTVKNVESLTLDGYNRRRVDLLLISSFQSMLTPTLAAASEPRAHDSVLQIDLSSLHLSGCKAASTELVIVPNLRSLTLFYADMRTTAALLNPVSLPQLEELSWFDEPPNIADVIENTAFQQLLPQLEGLVFSVGFWKDLANAQVRSAASRTLVDCVSIQVSDLPSNLHPIHLRAHGLSDFDQHTRRTTFSEETVRLTSYIESSPSLPLRSLYLTCSDPSTVHISPTSSGYVNDLSRVCRDRKIELIFETGPSYRFLDSCFSPNFSRKMKEQRKKENVK